MMIFSALEIIYLSKLKNCSINIYVMRGSDNLVVLVQSDTHEAIFQILIKSDNALKDINNMLFAT